MVLGIKLIWPDILVSFPRTKIQGASDCLVTKSCKVTSFVLELLN